MKKKSKTKQTEKRKQQHRTSNSRAENGS